MRRRGAGIPSRFILAFLSILCIVFMFVNYSTGFSGGPLQTVANYIFIPMQKGISYIGSTISVSSEDAKTKEELIAENEQLQAQIDELTTQITNMQLQQAELTELQELYELDQQYADYETTGAHVIAKDTSNWFDTFTIDKGSDDGIEVNMNVIAGSGLVGIVTKVGPGYAVVQSIINDSSAVSGMILDTADNCIISGDLESMTSNNTILLSNLEDTDDQVTEGTAVVTSNISDKYLPGILIGYVSTIEEDANGLTKSGTITPVVDFKHLQDVLVILETKETGE